MQNCVLIKSTSLLTTENRPQKKKKKAELLQANARGFLRGKVLTSPVKIIYL